MAEHQRLKDAVVVAAKEWFKWHGYIPELAPEHYEVALIKAMRELLESEDQNNL
jgi:hypothetical protein